MEIERITGKLLYKHDCVIVPGLGGFIANPKGATVHPGRHTFNPPFKAVLFNRSLIANDGLLVNEIARELKLSYSDSLQAINTFVREANNSLRDKHKVFFPELGYLHADIEGNIYFTQDNGVNFLLDAFGLDEFQSLPVVKTDRAAQRTTIKVDRGPQPITKSRKRATNRKVVFAGLAIALIFGALSFFVNFGMNGQFDTASFTITDKYAHVPATIWPDNEVLDIKVRLVVIDTMAEETPALVVEPAKIPVTAPFEPVVTVNDDKQYYVVAGCFEEFTNAKKYVEILKGDGISALIADKKHTKLYKVYLASFAKMSEAKNYVDGLKDSLATTVWIYTEK